MTTTKKTARWVKIRGHRGWRLHWGTKVQVAVFRGVNDWKILPGVPSGVEPVARAFTGTEVEARAAAAQLVGFAEAEAPRSRKQPRRRDIEALEAQIREANAERLLALRLGDQLDQVVAEREALIAEIDEMRAERDAARAASAALREAAARYLEQRAMWVAADGQPGDGQANALRAAHDDLERLVAAAREERARLIKALGTNALACHAAPAGTRAAITLHGSIAADIYPVGAALEGLALRRARVARRLGLREAAAALGMSASEMTRIERGEVEFDDPEVAREHIERAWAAVARGER